MSFQVPAHVRALLDQVVGPAARTWVYSHFLSSDGQSCFELLCNGAPVTDAQHALWCPVRGTATKAMWSSMVRSEAHVRQCMSDLDAALAQLDAEVDALGPWLTPSPTRLAIASLCAPLVLPPQGFAGFYTHNVLHVSDLPAEMQQSVARCFYFFM